MNQQSPFFLLDLTLKSFAKRDIEVEMLKSLQELIFRTPFGKNICSNLLPSFLIRTFLPRIYKNVPVRVKNTRYQYYTTSIYIIEVIRVMLHNLNFHIAQFLHLFRQQES